MHWPRPTGSPLFRFQSESSAGARCSTLVRRLNDRNRHKEGQAVLFDGSASLLHVVRTILCQREHSGTSLCEPDALMAEQ